MAKVREQDWLDATEYSQLDVYRAAKDQHRKWRLFAAGCCRHAILLALDPQMDQLVEGAEQFADGVISWDGMKKVRRLLTAIGKDLDPNGDGILVWSLRDCLVDVAAKLPLATLQVGHNARYAFGHARSNPDDRGEAYEAGVAEGERLIVALARCVFGNPFRPVAFDPTWRTPAVEAIAAGAYADRAFDRLPVLADALEDAGCDAADLFAHLRGPGPHARGCWALDLVLGKA